MKKQVLFGGILVAIASSSQAAPSSYGPIGPNITYGDASNTNTIYSPLANPAYNAIGKSDTEGYRFGLGINAQTALELKGLEGSTDYYDNNIKPYLNSNNPADATTVATNLNSFFDKYNAGKVSNITSVTVPLLIKSGVWAGGISLDYSYTAASEATFIKKGTITTAATGTDVSINSGAAALGINYKSLSEFALGYGTNIFKNNDSALSVGVTARYLSMLSNTKAIDFKAFVDDNLGSKDKSTNDYISDMSSGSSESAITADVGINWIHENYSIGLVGMNLTSPKFKIHNLSTTTSSADFASFIKSEFKLKPQYRVTGQINTASRHWTIAGSYDLVKANDLNDHDTQWWSASASYATNSAWYIPDVRVGVRGNMVGNKYTYTGVGLTFGFLNLDVATTTMDISGVSDKQKDAGAMASVGVEFDF
ncbi:MAG: conjugal transfer protein TraF [Thiotrichales bacterium]|nr:conjugal transfer protein TraF [Thiotrichales bacterium]